MNKIMISTLIIMALMFSACCKNKACAKPEPKPDTQTTLSPNYNYTGSNFEENYVWGGAMNMAWSELIDSYTHNAIELKTSKQQVLEMLKKLNDPVFSKKDMDAASYYVKSGYGQKTLDTINKECRQQFPTKSIDDLQIQLSDRDIISYAYFLKEIEYQIAFSKQDVRFNDELVKGFAANNKEYENIYILDYQNKDKFIIGIKLKDQTDQIFLAKGYPMDKPDDIVKALRGKAPALESAETVLGSPMNSKDVFQAPILHLDYGRSYKEMINQIIINPELRDYIISVMQEIIKFDMDEKGARVENEAVIVLSKSVAPSDEYKPKSLLLDKPYWVVMKRFDSNNPYFILGAQNTAVMKTAD
ncbi:MAG: hypothetical protein PHY48_13855 [Candidatus Cloacimonetes bacterium]|nr:hypothetical protein [Candidatus Cloacimonadota bacterium]